MAFTMIIFVCMKLDLLFTFYGIFKRLSRSSLKHYFCNKLKQYKISIAVDGL